MAQATSAVQRATSHLALCDPSAGAVEAAVIRNDFFTLKKLLQIPGLVTEDLLLPKTTASQFSTRCSHVATVTDLFDFGAEPPALNDMEVADQIALHRQLGGTHFSGLLHRAAAGRPQCLQELLSATAGRPFLKAAVNCKGKGGTCPLHVACCAGAALALLSAGAAVDSRSASGSTPLMTAAQHGRVGVLTLLLLRGAQIDAKTREVHACMPSRGVTAFCGSTQTVQAPRMWLPHHPPTALPAGRSRCAGKSSSNKANRCYMSSLCVQICCWQWGRPVAGMEQQPAGLGQASRLMATCAVQAAQVC
mgnify:CR=1 FL=1